MLPFFYIQKLDSKVSPSRYRPHFQHQIYFSSDFPNYYLYVWFLYFSTTFWLKPVPRKFIIGSRGFNVEDLDVDSLKQTIADFREQCKSCTNRELLRNALEQLTTAMPIVFPLGINLQLRANLLPAQLLSVMKAPTSITEMSFDETSRRRLGSNLSNTF